MRWPAARRAFISRPRQRHEQGCDQHDQQRAHQQLPRPAQFRHLVEDRFDATDCGHRHARRRLSGQRVHVRRNDRDDTPAGDLQGYRLADLAGLDRPGDAFFGQPLQGREPPGHALVGGTAQQGRPQLEDRAVREGEGHGWPRLRALDRSFGHRGIEDGRVGDAWVGLRRGRPGENRQQGGQQ